MAKAVSIKKNFFYSSFLTTANYLFTFITYPYVSRVLGVDRIGTVNFVDSVINYFIMLSMLGVGIVGIREIAKSKNNPSELNATYSSIISLNAVLTLAALAVLGLACLLVPQLNNHPRLMMFGAMKLVANMFLMDWVVKGLEDFRVITLRTFAVRALYVACVFLFVKEQSDYGVYYLLLSLSIVLNALFNMVYLRRCVSFSFAGLNLRRFAAPVFTLGLYMLFSSFYNSFNVVALGFYAGETEVGYYTTATKLFTILLSLFTAFCGVMLPRMSSLLAEGRTEEYTALLDKSVVILYAVSVPLVFFGEVFAPEIINLIAGKGYEGAILPMRICLPLLIVIGHTKILLQQGLMPLGRDKAILATSVIGGILALLLMNCLLANYKSVGSAWLWIISELGVNTAAAYFMFKAIGSAYPLKQLTRMVVGNLPLLALLVLVHGFQANQFLLITAATILTVIYSLVLQCFVFKDEIILNLLLVKLNKTK